MSGCAVLEEALARGARVIFDDPPRRPRLLVPKRMAARVQQDLPVVREVLRRAVLFRDQVRTSGPQPLLVVPGHEGSEGCLSCGAALGRDHFRCPLCVLAVMLALNEMPSEGRKGSDRE